MKSRRYYLNRLLKRLEEERQAENGNVVLSPSEMDAVREYLGLSDPYYYFDSHDAKETP